jgi:hypothetical protein
MAANCSSIAHETRRHRFAPRLSFGCLRAILAIALLWLAAGPASALHVVINELMYNTNQAQGNIEFIELYNPAPLSADVGGWEFTEGVLYKFPPNTFIPARGYLVVASSPTVFQAYYPAVSCLGPWVGVLDNAGEDVRLRTATGELVDDVDYGDEDPWPVAADGTGHSLALLSWYLENNDAPSWAISSQIGGTPGQPNFPTPPTPPRAYINELQSNPASGDTWIEFKNPSTTQTAVLTNCWLSDNRNQLNKYWIPALTIAPGGLADLTITTATIGFALKPTGGRILLTNEARSAVIDAVEYEGTAPGASRGRYFDARNHKEHWYYMTAPTRGNPNVAPTHYDVVINEIMYHPFEPRKNLEFIELYNRTAGDITMTGWRFTDGVRFRFTTGTVIRANSYLVVAQSTATMAQVYGLTTSQMVGNTSRTLGNDRDYVAIRDQYGNIVDEVRYFDGGRWPEWADGLGSSLELIDPDQSNDYPSAWAASDDSAKAQWTYVQYTKPEYGGESEFQMMLTDDGQAIIDDLSMVPSGGGAQYLTNGNFELGIAGWLLTGTHKRSRIVTGAGNVHGGTQALLIDARGRGTEGSNHIERDTALGLSAGQQYTISYWAKWVVGTPQLLTRTHFQGVAQTTSLTVPVNLGTPGQQNSRYQANQGPLIAEVSHFPVTPRSTQAVTVRALVLDSDGVSAVYVHYKDDTAGAFTQLQMFDDGAHGDLLAGDGVYGASLPARPNNTLVEFYIRAVDSLAVESVYPGDVNPPAPFPRRALYRVRDAARGTNLPVFELLINDDVANAVNARPASQKMDNETLDGTFVLDDRVAFYNVVWRQKGSGYTRPPGLADQPQMRIRFNSDQLLFGQHSINLDNLAAGGTMHDRMVQWLMYKMGEVPTPSHEYVRFYEHCALKVDRNFGIYDLGKRVDMDMMAAYYPDGDNGFLHKVDDHFEWDDGGGFTRNSDMTGNLRYLGADEEFYRWNFKPRSREAEDDFTSLVTMIRFMDPAVTDDATWQAGVDQIIETTEWLKKLACSALTDDWDTLGIRGGDPRGKNASIYVRSDTGKWVLIPWDDDLTFGNCQAGVMSDAFFAACQRLMTEGRTGRMYLRYLQQLIDGPFSQAQWNAEIDRVWALLSPEGGGDSPQGLKDWATCRRNYLTGILPGNIPFEITTNGGLDFAVDTPTVSLQGAGGLLIESFKRNRVPAPDATWLDAKTWIVPNIPLVMGANLITITAHDDQGTTIGTDSITVTRYAGLRNIPYGTSFEPTEAPPFTLGPLPQNLWTGRGTIQNTTVFEGQQAVSVTDGTVEHEFLGAGMSSLWLETYVRTAGSAEPESIPSDAGVFAAQLYFHSTKGILALDGNGAGGGVWVNTGVPLAPGRFIRIRIRLDYALRRWDLYLDGALIRTGLGFANNIAQMNRFRYYTDVAGAMDKFSVSAQSPVSSDVGNWRLY